MKTFYTRSLTAMVFAAIMLFGILWSGLTFYVLFLIIALGAMREYFNLVEDIDPGYRTLSRWHRPCVLLLVVAVFFMLSGNHFQFLYLSASFLGICGGLVLAIIIFINEGLFMDYFRSRNLLYSFLGLLYIALPLGLMVNLRLDYSWHGVPVIPLGIIFCIWINDTMAYITGSWIGKTKFFPEISPKKTWEGTLGGILLTIVAAIIYGYFGHTYTLVDWIVIAAIASVFGTAGDLLESKIKRLAGVKDSGTLMPGHGGILDRFDSMIVATPFVWLYAAIVLH
jgi:phosphatidate cytidylyltransferase